MSIITTLKNRAAQGSVIAGGLLMSAAASAEDAVDPAAAIVAKVEAAGVSAGAVGAAVLLVLVGIATYKLIKRAL